MTLQMSAEGHHIDDPMVYHQMYLNSFLQKPCGFVLLHQSVNKNSQLEGQPKNTITYNPSEKSIKADGEGDSAKAYPLSSFESIQWGTTESVVCPIKFIQIAIKNDRQPIILYDTKENMDLWYDGLRLNMTPSMNPESDTSKVRLNLFQKAVSYATLPKKETPAVPPPPKSEAPK